ncbi:hypothetical protein ACWGK1_33530 [Streptomyces wedmorensis]
MGDPYYTDPYAPPKPPSLRVFTGDTLPSYLRTADQIEQEGLQRVGLPVGLLSWTPRGARFPQEALVWDIRKAVEVPPREMDLFEMMAADDAAEAET